MVVRERRTSHQWTFGKGKCGCSGDRTCYHAKPEIREHLRDELAAKARMCILYLYPHSRTSCRVVWHHISGGVK